MQDRGMPTPWGPAQTKREVAEGIYEISTSSHGGFLVGKRIGRERLSGPCYELGEREGFGSWLVYEEDCDWSILALEVPEIVQSIAQYNGGLLAAENLARGCARRWHAGLAGDLPDATPETVELIHGAEAIRAEEMATV